MCGIAGQYQFGAQDASPADLERVSLHQRSRGPDARGIFSINNMALAHRRLKIFDLSERAAQPMVDHGLGLALTFNGEIYNFLELRRELEGLGYVFVSDSDTEVVLKAFHAWGKACIRRFNGMFAFAIWDWETEKLVLARDRMGIKPLYYTKKADTFEFASSLPALLQFKGIDTSIDRDALYYYLTFHAVPEPLTLLAGIRKLPPATILTIDPDGTRHEETYWRLQINEERADHTLTVKDWLAATEETLSKATQRQLAADVPTGILLSGGLDSSLLVALAAQRNSADLKTFAIGFEEVNGQSGDEFVYSDLVAEHFGTDHTQIFVPNTDLNEALADCVSAMSEPMVSHDNIGFYLLSHEVAKHVKVALSGQGADEIFAGYHWFEKLEQEPPGPAQRSAQTIADTVADRSYGEYKRLVSPHFHSNEHSGTFLESLATANGSPHPIDNLLAYESTFAMANGPLSRVDNMTMAAGLEARVPFLDDKVVDLAASMPLGYKMADGGKAILKRLGRKLLPKAVVDRPKGYFPVPALNQVQGRTLSMLRGVLSIDNIRKRGIFNASAVQNLLDNPLTQLTPAGASKLWQVGLLEYWLQRQGV
ncbi:N-acetylglutaminylglutamine amidotransferase [Methylovirgula sp. 4M-Z18]|uniref:N-acetylglutaminylglutamine amidotransferase n=1 Tax=Methylovirgula sp. 4M-Z18 TaxID=2293567 RepID=UPI000E2FDEF3|nr:N-acetylglutaminylglutamine amidotransferase [Methylovirgula sp. 4M-Z18]RFB81000.1 N-acetylglutaminylglutamine amidotransferase [Methylovirgula sp. 4M-Z18]